MLAMRDGNGTGNVHMISGREDERFFIDEDGTAIEYTSDRSDGMGWDYHVL